MAATHTGHCQICDRVHKVSGNHIAKHGYTIRNGWQQGVCYGHNGAPFEISCDLIDGAIEAAEKYIVATAKEIADLLAAPLDKEGRIWILTPRYTRNETIYVPERVSLALNARGLVTLLDRHGEVVATLGEKTIEAGARFLADERIKMLRQTIAESKDNIEWLGKRKASWAPRELQPLTQAELAAKIPKVHLRQGKYGYKNASACSASAMAAGTYRMTTDDRAKVTCLGCLREIADIDRMTTDDRAKVTCLGCLREIADIDRRAAEKAAKASANNGEVILK